MIAREPQGPIQDPMSGLLSLLGIKGLAGNPNSLAGSIQPYLDVFPFLVNRQPEVFFAAYNMAADENTVHIPFSPDQEIGTTLLVLNATAFVNVLDPSVLFELAITKSMAAAFISEGAISDHTDRFSTPLGGWGSAVYVKASMQHPLLLRHGDRLGVGVFGFQLNGAPAQTLTFRMEYLTLSV